MFSHALPTAHTVWLNSQNNAWFGSKNHVVQKDRVTPRRAEGPRDAVWCRETASSYGVQRDRATLQRTDTPRDATSCRGTARRYMVQRDRA